MDEKNLKESKKDKLIIFLIRIVFIGTLAFCVVTPIFLLVALFSEIIGFEFHLFTFNCFKMYSCIFVLVFFSLYAKIVGSGDETPRN